MWKCAKCGNMNHELFCPKCGTKMPDQPQQNELNVQDNYQQKPKMNFQPQGSISPDGNIGTPQPIPKSYKKILIICLCVVAFLFLVALGTAATILFVNLNSSDEDETVKTNVSTTPVERASDRYVKNAEEAEKEENETINYVGFNISRNDKSYKNDEGKVLIDYYYDLVVVDDGCPNADKINQAFEADMEAFWLPDSDIKDYATLVDPSVEKYCDVCETQVTHNSDGFLSAKFTTSWYMGGVYNQDSYGKTFDLNTGEEIGLQDLTGQPLKAFEQKIKDSTWAYLSDEYGDGMFPDAYDTLYGMGLDEFAFCLEDGEIVLFFPTYSLGPGAMGSVTYSTGININSL